MRNRDSGKLREIVRKNRENISQGYMLCLDPSCGSSSSMPGYAIYRAGEFVESGVIYVVPQWPLHIRLQAIGQCLRSEFGEPDVAVVESIPVRAIGRGRSRRGHASLLQAVGAMICSVNCSNVIYIDPRIWHRHTQEGWSKGDASDAQAMGNCVIEILGEIQNYE